MHIYKYAESQITILHHSCDNHQDVLQQEYIQNANNCSKYMKKNPGFIVQFCTHIKWFHLTFCTTICVFTVFSLYDTLMTVTGVTETYW